MFLGNNHFKSIDVYEVINDYTGNSFQWMAQLDFC